ncbi:MAG TPA: methyltransferase domain-containing protein [Candidatus Paceibacterota bacterium]|nr:methyltransferase domain-containing protein [Candidatus Paceibacterota bacterium]
MIRNTSWENVAGWYDELLASEGTYQRDLILPNLLRLVAPQPRDTIVDLACGPGFFSFEFANAGARVIGVDASRKLIERARKRASGMRKKVGEPNPEFRVAKADELSFVGDAAVDKIAIVLALQNIENVGSVFKTCARVMKPGGTLSLVVNHPAFRIPKKSSWGWDDAAKIQYRRIDNYLSESKVEIAMHPGKKSGEKTISFHRPLQFYFKALNKAGFPVTVLEEWNSNRRSEPGPRAAAENAARKEIPLFLFIQARRI